MATLSWTKPQPEEVKKRHRQKWEGNAEQLPWEYSVTAVIPHIDTPDELSLVVQLLRLQTEKPYILVIDTGSSDENLQQVESMRSHDLEVHTLKLNGVRHPSDPVAMAMDVAFAVCRTRFMFCTHSDCFPRRQDLLQDLASQCKTYSIVGYQLSPREHDDWKWMVGHTCTMLDMNVMDIHHITWSQRRLVANYGQQAGIETEDYSPCHTRPNWPDTELHLNYRAKECGITPMIIGSEANRQRNVNADFDHPRSFVSSKMYAPAYHRLARRWMESAKQEAVERIERWSA